jgi:hypothetical protein
VRSDSFTGRMCNIKGDYPVSGSFTRVLIRPAYRSSTVRDDCCPIVVYSRISISGAASRGRKPLSGRCFVLSDSFLHRQMCNVQRDYFVSGSFIREFYPHAYRNLSGFLEASTMDKHHDSSLIQTLLYGPLTRNVH